MTTETFCATIVPSVASIAYATAGIANLYSGRYLMAVMWLCYALANLCLIATFTRLK